jgi:hypothetical protein
MAALALDILKRITDVQWSGLAVEFGEGAADAPEPEP